jgi:hypothetical protein
MECESYLIFDRLIVATDQTVGVTGDFSQPTDGQSSDKVVA